MIKSWRNGARGKEVKEIIDFNFNLLSRYLSKDIKALSTQERKLLSSDYLSENTLVFDTDEEQWYKYSKGSWIKTTVGSGDNTNDVAYAQNILVNDWADNNINISFDQHGVKHPLVQLFIEIGSSLVPVLGGVKIDSEHNITLSTDLPFDGRIVIK